MKIAQIEPITVAVGIRNQLLVRIETACGIIGWGESGLSGREAAVAAAVTHFAAFLEGKDPLRIGRHWQEMYRSQYFEGGRVLTAAISAIDIALHDIAGKALDVPVYQLLGGRQRDRIECFGSLYIESDPAHADALVDQCEGMVRDGWRALRLLPAGPAADGTFDPRQSLADTARVATTVRAAIGPDIVLGLDFHHRLSPAETVMFCQRLPQGTLDFLEEPIRDESPEAYAALRQQITVPLAIGEEFSSKWQAAPFIDRGLTNFLRTDVCNIGGLTEAMKVAAMAETRYIDVMPHNPLGPVCTAATVHMCAALPNLAWVETHQAPGSPLGLHDPSLFPQQHQLDGTFYVVPDAPGLGVEIDEARLRAATPQPFEPPHLHSPDGGVTNW